MRRTLPNLITILRLLMLPLFVVAVRDGARPAAPALLLAIALSDWLDGFLARRWRATTRLGAFLDPLVDKLTQLVALVLLALTRQPVFTAIPPWFLGVVLGRDLILSYGALRIRAHRGNLRLEPRWEGKASTGLVFALLLASASGAAPGLVTGLALAAAPLVIAAGVRYTLDGRRQMRRRAAA